VFIYINVTPARTEKLSDKFKVEEKKTNAV
jgi:hypothetical protein